MNCNRNIVGRKLQIEDETPHFFPYGINENMLKQYEELQEKYPGHDIFSYLNIFLGTLGVSINDIEIKRKINKDCIEEISIEKNKDEKIIQNYDAQLRQLLLDEEKKTILNHLFPGIGDKLYINNLDYILNEFFLKITTKISYLQVTKDENYDQEIQKIILPIHSSFLKLLFSLESGDTIHDIHFDGLLNELCYYKSLELIRKQIKPLIENMKCFPRNICLNTNILIESENYMKYKKQFSYLLFGRCLFHFFESVIKMGLTDNIYGIDLVQLPQKLNDLIQ